MGEENNNPKLGTVFIGVDEKTWGKEGTGWVEVLPDYECTGGSKDIADRHCPPEPVDSTALTATGQSVGKLLHVNIASFR